MANLCTPAAAPAEHFELQQEEMLGGGADLMEEAGKELLREAALMGKTDQELLKHIGDNNSGDIPSCSLELNAYGVGIVCLAQGHDVWKAATTNVARVEGVFVIFFGTVVLLVNVLLQLFLIVFTRKYVLHSMASKMRLLYDDFRKDVFTPENSFVEDAWDKYDTENKEDLCKFPLSKPTFFFWILLIWTLSMFGEIRACFRTGWDLFVLPRFEKGNQVQRTTLDGKHVICGMRPVPLWCIYIFVLCPRLFIAYVTWWYGCRWLTCTLSFADLILNSCALGFITSVDEVLYSAIVPEHVRQLLANTCVYSPLSASDKQLRKWKDINLLTYLLSVFYWSMGAFATWIYIFKLQPVVPNWNWDIDDHCAQTGDVLSHDNLISFLTDLLPKT